MIERTQANSSEEQRADVFISHSRKAKDFVRRFANELAKRGRKAWVDVDSLTPTADFWPEVYYGIEGTDAFIFVISPDSAKSEDCFLEPSHAVKRHKRLIPKVCREVEDKAVPEPLRVPHWMYLRDSGDFDSSFQKLTKALDTVRDWLKEHTRLLM